MIKKAHPLLVVFLGSILYYFFISIRYAGILFDKEFWFVFFHCLLLLIIISLSIFLIIQFIKYYSLDDFIISSTIDKRICMISLGLVFAFYVVSENILHFNSTISNFHVFVLKMRNLKSFFTPFLPSVNFYILTLIGAPIIEEILFRGILQKYLIGILKKKSPLIAIALTSIAFSLIHWESQLLKDSVLLLLVGFLFGYIYYKTNKIIIPMTAHACWNLMTVLFTLDLQPMGRGNSLVFVIFMVVFCILANSLYKYENN